MNSLKRIITGEDADILEAIKESLELTLSQHISNLSMQIPDFANLRAKTRVRLRHFTISTEFEAYSRKIFSNAITMIFLF